MNNFFKHNDKVYSENLNDSVLVGNAFSWSISISLPTDSDGLFPSSSDVVKAKVADVYATPNTNLSIGSTIENSSGSSQVYRLTVYPNFNRFGGFTFVSLEGDGSVIITEKGGTNPVRNNLDYANLGNVTELKTLREYDLVVTIPSGGEVTGLSFGFQSSTASANATISQANVNGLTSALNSLESGKADTEHTHSSTDVTEASALSNIGTSANATQSVINGAVDEMVGSLDTSITNKVDTVYVSTVPVNSNLKFTGSPAIRYRRVGKVVTLRLWGSQASPTSTGWINIASIPTGYKPIEDVTIAMQVGNNTHITQSRTNNRDTVQCYVTSTGTEYVGLTATWFTNDDYPSQ